MILDKLVPRINPTIKESYCGAPSAKEASLKTLARRMEKFALLIALVTQVDTCQRNLLPESVDKVDITVGADGNLVYQFGSDARDE